MRKHIHQREEPVNRYSVDHPSTAGGVYWVFPKKNGGVEGHRGVCSGNVDRLRCRARGGTINEAIGGGRGPRHIAGGGTRLLG